MAIFFILRLNSEAKIYEQNRGERYENALTLEIAF